MEERKQKDRDDTEIQILPDEADTASLFLALATQWRSHAMTGQRLGMDYGAVEPTARMLDIIMVPAIFHDLREMEAAALSQFAVNDKRRAQ